MRTMVACCGREERARPGGPHARLPAVQVYNQNLHKRCRACSAGSVEDARAHACPKKGPIWPRGHPEGRAYVRVTLLTRCLFWLPEPQGTSVRRRRDLETAVNANANMWADRTIGLGGQQRLPPLPRQRPDVGGWLREDTAGRRGSFARYPPHQRTRARERGRREPQTHNDRPSRPSLILRGRWRSGWGVSCRAS